MKKIFKTFKDFKSWFDIQYELNKINLNTPIELLIGDFLFKTPFSALQHINKIHAEMNMNFKLTKDGKVVLAEKDADTYKRLIHSLSRRIAGIPNFLSSGEQSRFSRNGDIESADEFKDIDIDSYLDKASKKRVEDNTEDKFKGWMFSDENYYSISEGKNIGGRGSDIFAILETLKSISGKDSKDIVKDLNTTADYYKNKKQAVETDLKKLFKTDNIQLDSKVSGKKGYHYINLTVDNKNYRIKYDGTIESAKTGKPLKNKKIENMTEKLGVGDDNLLTKSAMNEIDKKRAEVSKKFIKALEKHDSKFKNYNETKTKEEQQRQEKEKELSGLPDWLANMSEEGRKQYFEEHPDSKYAKKANATIGASMKFELRKDGTVVMAKLPQIEKEELDDVQASAKQLLLILNKRIKAKKKDVMMDHLLQLVKILLEEKPILAPIAKEYMKNNNLI